MTPRTFQGRGNSSAGLSSKQAYDKLRLDIEDELEKYEKTMSWRIWLHSAFMSPTSCFPLSTALLVLASILILAIHHGWWEMSFLFTVLVFNMALVSWDSCMHHQEMPNKVRHILQNIPNEYEEAGEWGVVRGGRLLSLPSPLLVQGDLLYLRPGQKAPGKCTRSTEYEKDEVLEKGEVFAPKEEEMGEASPPPHVVAPARPAQFTLMETPSRALISCSLEGALSRPPTLFVREVRTLIFSCLQNKLLPTIVVLCMLCGGVRAWRGEGSWSVEVLLRPALASIPLLPLALPALATALDVCANAWLIALAQAHPKKNRPSDPFDEESEPEEEDTVGDVAWVGLVLPLLRGEGGYLWRTANLLKVLGSLTALCCVDKRGVLSFPNPTPEKVFFLKGDQDEDPVYGGGRAEVLDLTHNSEGGGVQFDDPGWMEHANSLKPLGLCILLNVCHSGARDYHTSFYDHLASLAMRNHLPLHNNGCLCDLAKQIGFSDSVVDYYRMEQLLGVFRRGLPSHSGALGVPRLRMPLPSMTAATLTDLHRGSRQLFCAGTADLVLDTCSDYWDGTAVRPLTHAHRKRVLDFYHRSSLTAHCMGFAYSPLPSLLPSHPGYLELPTEGLVSSNASPRSCETPPTTGGWGVCGGVQRHLSSDSLPPNEGDSAAEAFLGNAIFIGMVTTQYQACPEFVHLVEQLDKACVRFVHFSKENELRSRVFSEKMGLESGWNCHISLLSDKPKEEDKQREETDFSFPPHDPRKEVRHSSAPSLVRQDCSVGVEEDAPSSDRVVRAGSVEVSSVLLSSCASGEHPFDMSNRAKLPKGVENIRPHIEQVDNVPLQVSLFTDCTGEGTRAMLAIMQDYGETVCCVGSSHNPANNTPLFLQADASIALEPRTASACGGREGVGGSFSSSLSSLPCCLLLPSPPFHLHRLIVEARHLLLSARTSLEFLACSSACVCVAQGLSAAFLLPLPLSPAHTLWVGGGGAPLLTLLLLLLGGPAPHAPPPRKNLAVTTTQGGALRCFCFCVRFLPSACGALAAFAATLHANGNGSESLYLSQNVFSFFLLSYLAVISASYLPQPPWRSRKWWAAAVTLLVCFHAGLCSGWGSLPLSLVPHPVWVAGTLCPIAALVINELVRRHEIKVNVRQQKRARLEFCTKLGMNSPF